LSADYCELCELPLSTCVHGMPPPPPPPAPAAAKPRVRAARAGSHILRILADADGRLDADDLMLELEIRLEETLTPGDRERSPQGGDRWHVAVRRQRKALIDEGLLVPAQPGVWQLTPQGLADQ
jgi:hypothetical protein